MKMKFGILVVSIFTMFSSCYSQLVKTKSDIMLIKQNEDVFLNKPLYVLLKEIKPEIKLFFAEQGNIEGDAGHISFYFVDYDTYISAKGTNKKFNRITVTLSGKERVTSNDYSLPVEKRFLWNDHYKEKNQNLIIKRILISQGIE